MIETSFMKKVIRLTESDLEKIVRRVISEQQGVNGSIIQKKSEQVKGSRSELIDKWKSYFPDVAWFQQTRQKARDGKYNIFNPESLQDQGLEKMYSAFRMFIDPTVPDLDDEANFYSWLEKKSVEQKYHNPMTKWFNDMNTTQQLLMGMIPVLNMSSYPQTLPYEESLAKAQRVSPELKDNKFFSSTNQVLPQKAYKFITQG